MVLNNFILFFLLTSFGFLFYKYFILMLKKYNLNLLVDNEFKKTQAFHEFPTPTIGGLGIFLSFLILCLFLFLTKGIIYFEYISFCALFFILGFLDDLKINVRPKFRLILMIVFLVILITLNKFYIENVGIEFLNRFLEIDIFGVFFVCLCFLFIINGSNLIDGYNGLLSIHTLIILTNLFFINYLNENSDLSFFIFCQILVLIVFLKYNFPKASIFLGDSGSYFLGAFIAISTIKTSIANPSISPFYFCILLYYLFFEVFFSFIRKIIVEKKSPLFPDKKHLHMLIYKNFIKRNNNKLKSNYLTTLVLNAFYLILILPGIFMMNNGMFCKYYAVGLLMIYVFSYRMILNKLIKLNVL